MEDCIFCKIVRGEIPAHKVYEDEHTFAFFDMNPKNEYHTLAIPKKHYASMFDIPENEAVNMIKATKKIIDLYNQKLGLENLHIISNSGKHAQQEVLHLHFHIVPRYPGDGQNSKWPQTIIEIRDKFDELLLKLK